jgi:uncharacterized membrane protein
MTSDVPRSKRPVTALAGPYGHPFHPILVTVPIGAWIASLVFDIGSRIVDNPGFLTWGSVWLIVIGLLGAGLAALFGLMDLLTVPRGTRAFRVGLTHMTLNLLVAAAYTVNFFWRRAGHGLPGPVAIGPLVLSAVSLAVLAVSGYLGGMLAYRYGVRVAEESTQAEGYRTAGRTPPVGGQARPAD